MYSLAVYHGDMELMLCKSRLKRAVKRTVKFVKKHKGWFIAGAAVGITVGVLIYALPAVGTVAGAAGAATSASSQQAPSKIDKPNAQDNPQETPIVIPKDPPKLEDVFDETCFSFKEMIVEDSLVTLDLIESGHARSVRETFRDLGS